MLLPDASADPALVRMKRLSQRMGAYKAQLSRLTKKPDFDRATAQFLVDQYKTARAELATIDAQLRAIVEMARWSRENK